MILRVINLYMATPKDRHEINHAFRIGLFGIFLGGTMTQNIFVFSHVFLLVLNVGKGMIHWLTINNPSNPQQPIHSRLAPAPRRKAAKWNVWHDAPAAGCTPGKIWEVLQTKLGS